jgi:flagellar biosynthesis chaperone FliJ
MAVSRALRRLLRIRELQEEQSRLALESALGELHRLEHALTANLERERRGRSLILTSAQTNYLTDRLAGLEETRSASLHAAALGPRIDGMGEEVTGCREDFLYKRVERRQAETLIRETEAREAIVDARRSQQSLDDWYSSRMYRDVNKKESDTEPAVSLAEGLVSAKNVISQPAASMEKCVRENTLVKIHTEEIGFPESESAVPFLTML